MWMKYSIYYQTLLSILILINKFPYNSLIKIMSQNAVFIFLLIMPFMKLLQRTYMYVALDMG